MPWTEKEQARLEELAETGLSSFEIAKDMRKSHSAVRRRAQRTGVRIYRPEDRPNDCIGIRPFTDKCAELMRRAGVRLSAIGLVFIAESAQPPQVVPPPQQAPVYSWQSRPAGNAPAKTLTSETPKGPYQSDPWEEQPND